MGETELAEPLHQVHLGAYEAERTHVTKAKWDEVRSWATNHGYSFDNRGWGKGPDHPVRTIDWYDCLKWCNARTEMEIGPDACCYYTNSVFKPENIYRRGEADINNACVNWGARGYRLPTEAEWEKAARGGVDMDRMPLMDVNALAAAAEGNKESYASKVGPSWRCDPCYGNPSEPAGSISTNGYGVCDIAGPVWEWCWDWYAGYTPEEQTDPRGPDAAPPERFRVIRGGAWYKYVEGKNRAAGRAYYAPGDEYYFLGFRCFRSR